MKTFRLSNELDKLNLRLKVLDWAESFYNTKLDDVKNTFRQHYWFE